MEPRAATACDCDVTLCRWVKGCRRFECIHMHPQRLRGSKKNGPVTRRRVQDNITFAIPWYCCRIKTCDMRKSECKHVRAHSRVFIRAATCCHQNCLPLVIPTLQHTNSPNELTRNVNILTATRRLVTPFYQSTRHCIFSSAAVLTGAVLTITPGFATQTRR